jgi:tripartite-type tricarboxylate transporter receptor subunit TctC
MPARLTAFLFAACALAACAGAVAQGYPTKAVKFVMPAAPGSSPDRVSRLLAERLRATWGVAVLVENRPGATGTVGSEYVMRSDPDGYTALFAFTSVVQAPALLPRVPYDIEKDFAPVSLVAYAPVALAVRADSPYRTLGDLLAAAKNASAPVSYGTFGNGSTFHILGETLRRAAGAHFVHVPYKGEALSFTDLLGGQIQSSWNSVGLLSSHVRAGKARVLAVAHASRTSALPEAPTFAELGYPQVSAALWFGVLVPGATPRPVVERMNADINAVFAQEAVAKTLRDTGIEPAGTTPERFAEVLRADAAKWKQMIREAGITLE